MPFQCVYCADLSISTLVNLARTEPPEERFSQQAFYQHHESVADLQKSAEQGCAFCNFIVQCLKGYTDTHHIWATTWLGSLCEPSKSLFEAAAQSPASDIKIRLLPRGKTHLDSLRGFSVLDTLYVQVGPSIGHGAETEVDNDDDSFTYPDSIPDDLPIELPLLLLKIDGPSDERLFIDGYRVGAGQVDPDLSSAANSRLARGWLDECRTTHKSCLRDIIPELPSRVIDVGDATGSSPLRLLCTNGLRAPYVALSHCWGGKIETVLLSDKLQSFQRSLQLDDLAANFQDAVAITRSLGIRYLWIDSLCIIQDSKEDWATESKKMGLIYRDSTITLSAMASPGSGHGILRSSRVTSCADPTPVQLPVYSGTDSRMDTVRVERVRVDEESLYSLDAYGPLGSRGWCLQESILPPRQLYFGERQIYWRCPAGYRAADDIVHEGQVPEDRYSSLSEALHSELMASPTPSGHDQRANEILRDYYKLVERYSHRSLTFGSDKLPAFSGICQRLQMCLSSTYLAGLWTRDLASGLLWQRKLESCCHAEVYRAPSWSWAVTNEPIMFGRTDLRVVTNHVSLALIRAELHYRDPTNVYGEVTGGSITLRGPTLQLQRSSQTVLGNRWSEDCAVVHYDEELKDNERVVNLSHPETFAQTFTWQSQYLQVVTEAAAPYLLSINADVSGDPLTRGLRGQTGEATIVEEDYVAIDPALFSQNKHIALIARVDDLEIDDGQVQTYARGLILRDLENTQAELRAKPRYERIGIFEFTDFDLDDLAVWENREVDIF
ncbi:hypothetical protein E8E11_004062 [Didymella keratinophila]|nr:hypothetical protein E8E11_004062 [Didymella keratinophila]